MAGTLVSVFIDPTDSIEPISSGLGLRIEGARPGGQMGVGDDWILFIQGPRPIETLDRLIETMQTMRARELRRLATKDNSVVSQPAPV